MTFTIARNGSHLGSFSEEEIREGVNAGRFTTADLAWREGMLGWETLASVFGLPVSAGPPPLPAQMPWAAPSMMPGAPPVRKSIGDDAGMRLLLPVGRSGWAIAAGYLGLFSLIVLPAPVAIIVSIIALKDIKKSKAPGQKLKHGTGRAIFGLVAGIAGCLLPIFYIMSLRH